MDVASDLQGLRDVAALFQGCDDQGKIFGPYDNKGPGRFVWINDPRRGLFERQVASEGESGIGFSTLVTAFSRHVTSASVLETWRSGPLSNHLRSGSANASRCQLRSSEPPQPAILPASLTRPTSARMRVNTVHD